MIKSKNIIEKSQKSIFVCLVTFYCTYITHALKYIEPVLGHIVHVPKSTYLQCTRNICAVCFLRICNDLQIYGILTIS